jgi:hypothetical protein
MRQSDARWVGALLLLALVFVSGCKKKPAAAQATNPPAPAPENTRPAIDNYVPAAGRMIPENDLRQFAQFYMTEASAGKPPRSLADMPDLRRDMSKAYAAFEKGLYVVNWGADPSRASAGTSQTVLAYEKATPEKGGVVVFLDGSVRNVTAQEFHTFAKPGAK